MKKHIGTIIALLILIAGAGIFLYPVVSNWLNSREQSYVVQSYSSALSALDEAKIADEWQKAQAYNQALGNVPLSDPYTSEAASGSEAYLTVLNIADNGVMGSIKIPKINVDLAIYHGTAATVLEHGIGHLEGSAVPVGGEGTHAVLTGHTGLRNARLFTDLEQLAVGDEFYLYILDEVLAYQVQSITVVEPTDVSTLEAVPGEDLVTLVTCTPYGINSHRLLVTGVRVPYTEQEIAQRVEDTQAVIGREVLVTLVALAVLAVIVVVAVIVWAVCKKRIYKRKTKKVKKQ